MDQSQVVDGASCVRSVNNGAHTVSLVRAGCDEYFVTASLLDGEHPYTVFERVAETLRGRDAKIVSMVIAGIPNGLEALSVVFGPVRWPVTWIDKSPHAAIGGVHLWAVAGPTLWPIRQRGAIVGTRFDDRCATYCRIGGLVPEDAEAPPASQARSILERMDATLRAANMEFADVVRTWFYNRDITGWYGEFNRVRTRFFESHGVFQRIVPASTGVGGADIGAFALTAGLLAIRPKDAPGRTTAVDSPLQCPATNYGSSFSRAVAVALPDHARLLVSGTASISPQGQTEHVGDIDAQVNKTFEVVGTILETREFDWDDVTNGVAYVKRVQDLPIVEDFLKRNRFEQLPLLVVHADICRDDLLFELEVNAISAQEPNN